VSDVVAIWVRFESDDAFLRERELDDLQQRLGRKTGAPSRRHEAVPDHHGASRVGSPEEADGAHRQPGGPFNDRVAAEDVINVAKGHPRGVPIVFTRKLLTPPPRVAIARDNRP
jgi:hypothetical protein